MYLYKCINICISNNIRIYAYMHIYRCMCIHIYIYTHVCIYIYIYMYVRIYVYINIYVYLYICICMYGNKFLYIYIYIYMYVFICMYICKFAQINVFVCMCKHSSIQVSHKLVNTWHLYIYTVASWRCLCVYQTFPRNCVATFKQYSRGWNVCCRCSFQETHGRPSMLRH